ncbi:hypothetical protein ACKWMZ_05495 [Pseudomonas protegens]|uniref:hypothetical protein n=1 Tax=Pseudomonas protegens TaxID=380021 RepID=UPI001373557A|nr:hypothetical protein [Pseudomonas protegens]NAN55250.1 hypothetical protein [Pseudomonas protegens]NUE77273.1 hypothetical protein [Pseudomonas protegens]
MPTSLSKYLKIPHKKIDELGALDPVLDLDTRLFLDPHLLKHAETPEFKDSYGKLQARFLEIGKLLLASTQKEDVFWRAADKKMRWHEVRGLCIGYSSSGTAGSGIGPELRRRVLVTAKTIIEAGKNDPELFELVGLFEGNFGPDRISDMTANIIEEDILAYSRSIYKLILPLGWSGTLDKKTGLPQNPFTKEPILLVPKELLRDLPAAFDWTGSDEIGVGSEDLKEKLNKLVGNSWRSLTIIKKSELKELVFKYPDLMDDLISQYTAKEVQPYDFEEDKTGEYIWYRKTQDATQDNPLKLELSAHPTIDEVEALVLKICEKFKSLVENNGLNTLFYNNNDEAKNESAVQLAFYGVADSYCEANNIMIARESNSGRGPVDFKFGSNAANSVLVEVKKSTNSSLTKGVEKQLPEYMKSEKSRRAIYLIIDVGTSKTQQVKLNALYHKIKGSAIKIFHIDGFLKPSASKL